MTSAPGPDKDEISVITGSINDEISSTMDDEMSFTMGAGPPRAPIGGGHGRHAIDDEIPPMAAAIDNRQHPERRPRSTTRFSRCKPLSRTR